MTEVTWASLYAQAEFADPRTLKASLDLVAVCEAVGIYLEQDHNGKWHGLCPFHDDHDPSLDVYTTDDGVQRVGCMACDFGRANDVFDLLMALRGYGFAEAVREAQELVATCATGTRSNPAPRERPSVDLSAFTGMARARVVDDPAPVDRLLHERGFQVPRNWLIETFDLGVTPDGGGVVVPHRDVSGACVAAKIRRPGYDRPWRPISVEGSRLSALYGVWRDQGHRNVLLVEGESDAWVAAWLLRDRDWDVFALPSGATARPAKEWVDHLNDRDVTLMFDGDSSGRLAMTNWRNALGVVRVAQLDEGRDVASERADRVLAIIEHAPTVGTSLTPGLVEMPFGGYTRANDQNFTPVTDFVLALRRTIEVDGEGFSFDVALPNGRVVRLDDDDLENDKRLNKWAGKWGYTAVNATTRDARELKRMLLADAPFHPRVRGVRYAGLVEGSFVLPDEVVGGAKNWAYVPPLGDTDLADQLALKPGPWHPAVPHVLAHLHRTDVVTPIIGWIAAAPLRSLMRSFPFLAVTGIHGSGKSTLLREILSTFGFRTEVTLSSTTPYATETFFASTNAYPIWFDEYRAGARLDTREKFEQLLRDAWDAQTSRKGGIGDEKQALHKVVARAPIAVTGEDVFSEGSHLERAVLINLPLQGRNPDALHALKSIDRRGFGRAYLEWLTAAIANETVGPPAEAYSRPEHARLVARWGYEVFTLFANTVCGVEVPTFDDALITRPHTQVRERPAIIEALRACLNRSGRNGPIVWRDGEDLCVHHHDLVRACHELRIPLPGNARAVEDEITQRWDAVHDEGLLGQFLRIRGGVPLSPGS